MENVSQIIINFIVALERLSQPVKTEKVKHEYELSAWVEIIIPQAD